MYSPKQSPNYDNLLNKIGIVSVKKSPISINCLLCGNMEFCNIIIKEDKEKYGICNICPDPYNKNMECHRCHEFSKIDYFNLKNEDEILGGRYAFIYCYDCLKNIKSDVNIPPEFIHQIFDVFFGTSDEDEYDKIHEAPLRVLGKHDQYEEFLYEYPRRFSRKEKNIILKKINNCYTLDQKKLGIKGNLDIKTVINILIEQDMRCYVCNESLLIDSQKYCCYQFSIDRINNALPHNKDNIKISCYYCNCRDHPNFDQNYKICNSGCHTKKKVLLSKRDLFLNK